MPECKKSSTLFDSGISLVSHQQPHPRTLLFFFSLPQWKEEEGEEKSHWSLTHFCLIPNSSNFTSAYIMSTILQKFYFCVATQVTWFSVPFVPFQRIIIESLKFCNSNQSSLGYRQNPGISHVRNLWLTHKWKLSEWEVQIRIRGKSPVFFGGTIFFIQWKVPPFAGP